MYEAMHMGMTLGPWNIMAFYMIDEIMAKPIMAQGFLNGMIEETMENLTLIYIYIYIC
jgi:hypothetical protein